MIDSTTAAKILGYRSAGSLSKARQRGHLVLDMFSVPFRKGLYTSPRHLAAYLRASFPQRHLPIEEVSDERITVSDR